MSRGKVYLVGVSKKGTRNGGWSLIVRDRTRIDSQEAELRRELLTKGLGRWGEAFPRSRPLGWVSRLALSLRLSSLLPFLLPHISCDARPRTSLQPAALITSFHFNSAELGASELKRKFTQNTRQIECAGISEIRLTLSAPSCSLPLALP